MEGGCNSVSSDRTGRADQHGAQTRKPRPATPTVTKADAAQAQASQQQQTVSELKGDVSDLKANMASTVVYGSPFFNNTGCLTETGPAAGGFLPGALANCTGDTRVAIEATGGVWFKVYDGAKEKLNWGRILVRNTRS